MKLWGHPFLLKKPDHPYTTATREQTLERGRKLRGAEIRAGLDWAEELIAESPELQPLTPLIDGAT